MEARPSQDHPGSIEADAGEYLKCGVPDRLQIMTMWKCRCWSKMDSPQPKPIAVLGLPEEKNERIEMTNVARSKRQYHRFDSWQAGKGPAGVALGTLPCLTCMSRNYNHARHPRKSTFNNGETYAAGESIFRGKNASKSSAHDPSHSP